MKDTQDFIEKFTPDYSRSQDIADEMNLFIALHEPEDMSDDSSAMRVFKSYSQEDLDNNKLKIDWMEARIQQLETAIDGYINQVPETKYVAVSNRHLITTIEHEGAHIAALEKYKFTIDLYEINDNDENMKNLLYEWCDYSFLSKQEYDSIESFDPDDEVQVAQVYLIEFIR